MRLMIALLGWELDLSIGPAEAEDDGAALSGGTLTSEAHRPEGGDRYMGFTNGREGDGE